MGEEFQPFLDVFSQHIENKEYDKANAMVTSENVATRNAHDCSIVQSFCFRDRTDNVAPLMVLLKILIL